MYTFDKSSKKPLYVQLLEQLKKDIISNYKIGQKLPSIRKICASYDLSKNTVEGAYSQLVIEGFIQSIPKSAFVVTYTNYETSFTNCSVNIESEEEKEEYKYNFLSPRLEKDSFPLKLWKRLFNKAVNESIDFGIYQNGQGEYDLRVQIAKYLVESRGIKCNASQIIICNGFADSMGLLAKFLKHKYKTLAMENPGYDIARKSFESYNYKIEKIPITKNGIEIDSLKKSNAKLVYVTPSHQYPKGWAMPISNRIKLLNWANSCDGIIIEDDYDSELRYISRPIPSLQGLDNFEKVVYVGTFSKVLSPAIRVSYMVLPRFLIKKFKESYEIRASRVCITTQKTLELFIRDGYWDKHLRKIRTLNKKKHNLMKELLEENLKDTFKIESFGGGLAILINPTVAMDFEVLKKEALKRQIKLHFVKKRCGDEWNALMMGFGGFNDQQMKEAVKEFSKAWFSSIN